MNLQVLSNMQIIPNISISDIYIKRNAMHRGTPQNHGQSLVLSTWKLNDLTSQCNEMLLELLVDQWMMVL